MNRELGWVRGHRERRETKGASSLEKLETHNKIGF